MAATQAAMAATQAANGITSDSTHTEPAWRTKGKEKWLGDQGCDARPTIGVNLLVLHQIHVMRDQRFDARPTSSHQYNKFTPIQQVAMQHLAMQQVAIQFVAIQFVAIQQVDAPIRTRSPVILLLCSIHTRAHAQTHAPTHGHKDTCKTQTAHRRDTVTCYLQQKPKKQERAGDAGSA